MRGQVSKEVVINIRQLVLEKEQLYSMHEHDHLKHFLLEDLISEKIGAKESEPAAK